MRIYKAIILAAAVVSAAAQAKKQDSQDLWSELEKEKSWQSVSIEVPGLKGNITGFMTDSGEVHLDQVGQVIESEATIHSPVISKHKSTKRYLEECDVLGGKILAGLRKLKHPFTLRMKVYPARSSNLNLIVQGQPVTSIGTQFQELGYFKAELAVKPKAYLVEGGILDVVKFQNEVVRQLANQRAEIQKTGVVELDLTGLDEVACDLVSGQAQLKILSNMHYSDAKLKREARIRGDEFAKVYGRVKGSWQSMGSLKRNTVMAGAKLGLAIERELNLIPNLSDDEVVRLHDLMFESTRNELRSIGSYEFAELAARLDVLSRGSTYSNPIYHAQIAAPLP